MSAVSFKALAAVTFWGLSFVATRVALGWLTPGALVATRLVLGSLTIFVTARLTHGHAGLRREDRRRCVLLGLVLAVHLLIQNVGLLKTTATNTGWIIGFIPITIALGSRIFLQERFANRGWVGIAVGAGGIALVLLSAGVRFTDATVGDLLQLSSCLTWTAYTLLAVGTITRNGSRSVTQWTIGVAACTMLLLCIRQPVFAGPASWSALLSVLFLGTVCSGLAYWLWYAAIREVGSTTTGAYLYLEPFVTWSAAAILLGEHISWLGVAGGVVVLAGVGIVTSARKSTAAS